MLWYLIRYYLKVRSQLSLPEKLGKSPQAVPSHYAHSGTVSQAVRHRHELLASVTEHLVFLYSSLSPLHHTTLLLLSRFFMPRWRGRKVHGTLSYAGRNRFGLLFVVLSQLIGWSHSCGSKWRRVAYSVLGRDQTRRGGWIHSNCFGRVPFMNGSYAIALLAGIKGTLTRDFWPLVFFIKQLPLGHWYKG
jgi:hypothetical protein